MSELRKILKEISKPIKPPPLKERFIRLENEMSMMNEVLEEVIERLKKLEKGDR